MVRQTAVNRKIVGPNPTERAMNKLIRDWYGIRSYRVDNGNVVEVKYWRTPVYFAGKIRRFVMGIKEYKCQCGLQFWGTKKFHYCPRCKLDSMVAIV